MNTLKIAALAVALVATSASAQTAPAPAASATPKVQPSLSTDEGWNSDWALLFSLNNILTSGSILSASGTGSISASYFLADDAAVRAGVSLSRSHNPNQLTKVVTLTGTDNTTTYNISNPSGFTEFHAVNVRGDYLKRLSSRSIAPYLGGGVSAGWSWTRNNLLDDVSVVDQRLEIDNHSDGFNVNGHGIVGAEWRLHSNFALYAEYGVTVNLYQLTQLNNRTTVENNAGGTPTTTQNTTQRTTHSFLQLSTGLSQGGTLGLQVFF